MRRNDLPTKKAVVGYRLDGEFGWRLAVLDVGQGEVEDALLQHFRDLRASVQLPPVPSARGPRSSPPEAITVRELPSGIRRADGSFLIEERMPHAIVEWRIIEEVANARKVYAPAVAERNGWWQPRRHQWQPPEWPEWSPAGDPQRSELRLGVRMLFHGRIIIEAAARGIRLRMALDEIEDPLVGLVRFVRALQRGQYPRFAFYDLTDSAYCFATFPSDGSDVRLRIETFPSGGGVPGLDEEGGTIDIRIERQDLELSLRRLFAEIAAHPSFEVMWCVLMGASMDSQPEVYDSLSDAAEAAHEEACRRGSNDDDKESWIQFTADYIARRWPVSEEDKAFIATYRRMLLDLEIPAGW